MMERKTIPFFATKVDEELGIVDHIVSVFGVIDGGNDRVWPGAFTKTIAERGRKIRVLDQHRMESVRDVVGKPLMLQEVGRDALPTALLEQFPEATGGLKASTQFLLDTPEGLGVFRRIKEEAIDEWSFAYDPLDYDHENVKVGDQTIAVRNLRTLKLWEYSPVVWGMNPATTTLGAKQGGEEGKPWDVFLIDGEHCVYRVNEEETRELGPRIDDTYRTFDLILGEILARLDEETVVFVVSDHGHGPWTTWFGRGTPGGHTNSPDGIFVAAGPGIQHLDLSEDQSPSCYDLTPTILHLCGLPVARDMNGRVLYEIFTSDSRGALPARSIASYESPDGDNGEVLAGEGDEELFRRLQALGYIR